MPLPKVFAGIIRGNKQIYIFFKRFIEEEDYEDNY